MYVFSLFNYKTEKTSNNYARKAVGSWTNNSEEWFFGRSLWPRMILKLFAKCYLIAQFIH